MSTFKRVVLPLCAAQVLGMLGFAAFPTLVPEFRTLWALSNAEAGVISGIYYGAYMLAVPVLVSLTDRMDARRVHMASSALAATGFAGFALLADGSGLALLFQAMAGAGLAGTYMPGLKVLTDHAPGPNQSRLVSFYTASFALGAGISYAFAGTMADLFGWRWAFGGAAFGALAAILIHRFMLPPVAATARPGTRLLDFRPVLRTRAAMAYILGYAGHMWELFAMRAWIVAFFAFSATRQEGGGLLLSAALAASLVNLIGQPASIGGNELCVRLGRRRVVLTVMLVSVGLSFLMGFTSGLPSWAVLGLGLVYGVAVMLDSAALTAGAVANAPDGYRGTTLALHSTFGFGSGFIGTLAVGFVLDAFDDPATGWGFAFATMGAGGLAGALALGLLGRRGRA